MSPDPKISEFIDRARAGGASEQSLVGILTARGWPEKEVYEALAAHYEGLTGIEIPRRGASGTAAKDAFFYLLLFSTLTTWTFGFGSLAFTLIDKWLADTLFSPPYYSEGYDQYNVASALAAIIVAFPIYLLVSRIVVREGKAHPDKLNSPVRKWLTYLALVIAAGVFIGDLIAALTYLLRGEITSRFLAKALVVLVLSGGVFFYYFGGLRKSEESEVRGKFTLDALMAILSAAAVTVIVILGFSHIGAPKNQRTLRSDQKRVQDLFSLSQQINAHWTNNAHKLPEHLDELSGVAFADPVTRIAYEYRVKGASQYELCAAFSADNRKDKDPTQLPAKWSHPAGRYCFTLDAAQAVESPAIYFPD